MRGADRTWGEGKCRLHRLPTHAGRMAKPGAWHWELVLTQAPSRRSSRAQAGGVGGEGTWRPWMGCKSPEQQWYDSSFIPLLQGALVSPAPTFWETETPTPPFPQRVAAVDGRGALACCQPSAWEGGQMQSLPARVSRQLGATPRKSPARVRRGRQRRVWVGAGFRSLSAALSAWPNLHCRVRTR